ncbi:MAG: lactate utilization protein [Nitratireductor sp.]
MSARDAIMGKLRKTLGAGADDATRRETVAKRLAKPPKGIVPERGQGSDAHKVKLFCQMAEAVAASVTRVRSPERVPKIVSDYLRSRNLPASVRMGADRRLKAMPWDKLKSLELKSGPSDGFDEVGVSHAFAGIAETGTVALLSGKDNPSTVNFLPEHHIVVIDARDIAGDLETVLSSLRRKFGKGRMPRTVNFVTGPSRSGDIEQKIILGAHGPRALHLIVVG